jgi:hypothetical protein
MSSRDSVRLPGVQIHRQVKVALPVLLLSVKFVDKPAGYLFEKATREDVDWCGDLEDTAMIDCNDCQHRGGVQKFATEEWLVHRSIFLEGYAHSPIDGDLKDLLGNDEQTA